MYHQALQIEMTAPQMIALAGAGGKTSLMYALAREALAAGCRTAITTTTHIARPEGNDIALCESFSPTDYQAALAAGKIIAAGQPVEEDRYGSPGDGAISWLRQHCDMLYVEADGSRRLPLKYPAGWEPVIPPGTTRLVVVMGLSALGQPLAQGCHRYQLARQQGVPLGEIVTEADIAALISRGYGRYQPTVVLNQADNGQLLARGRQIKTLLDSAGLPHTIIASIKGAKQCWS
jgi:probable selenium-dependent hydroxylase accessory protein YqeC